MLGLTRDADLLWTNPTKSVWNTTFKIIFIGTQSYTIFLMLNDYKPTHDPNIDTFKVQYLLGGSAVLAIVFPYYYTPAEVRAFVMAWKIIPLRHSGQNTDASATDALGLLDLARSRSDSATALHAPANWRGRDNHHPLPLCSWRLPSAVHSELDLAVFHGRRLHRPDTSYRRHHTNGAIFRLLLDLLYEVSSRQQLSRQINGIERSEFL